MTLNMSDEVAEALATFRRASRNGQPMLAIESLVPVVDWLLTQTVVVAETTEEPDQETEAPKARTASSRKTTKAAEEPESVATASE